MEPAAREGTEVAAVQEAAGAEATVQTEAVALKAVPEVAAVWAEPEVKAEPEARH